MQQQQLQGYDSSDQFSARPQPVQARSKYRNPNENGYRDTNQQDRKSYNSDQAYDTEEEYGQQNYYEELQDPVEDEDELEPDYYIDRPPTPEYKPKERGKDVSIQVEDYELFDFELEVEPILQILVGKTTLQARMELIQEWENEELLKHKKQFIRKRNAELLVTQTMENAYTRRKEERERRTLQHKLRRDQEKLQHKKLIARVMSKTALQNMTTNALDDLESQGFLRDNFEISLRKQYVPWLLEKSLSILQSKRALVQEIPPIVSQPQADLKQQHKESIVNEAKRRQEVLEQRERDRLEREDRIRRKAIWKKKQQINQEREDKLLEIQKKVIQAGQRIENLLDADITDIFSEGRNQPITGIFGGIVGQLWIIIDVLSKLSADENSIVNPQLIEDITLKIVQNYVKNTLNLLIKDDQQEFFETQLKKFEENPQEFEATKQAVVSQLTESLENFQQSLTLGFLIKKQNLNQQILQSILRALINVIFTPLEGAEEKVVNKSLNKSLNASLLDVSISQVKNKILVNFGQESTDNLKYILRIRIPFQTDEDIYKEQHPEEEEKKPQEQAVNRYSRGAKQNDKSQQQAEVPERERIFRTIPPESDPHQANMKDKYDELIDTFDGDGYLRIRDYLKSIDRKRRDLRQLNEFPIQFNINLVEPNSGALQDERSQYFFRLAVYKILLESYPDKFKNIQEATFLQKCIEIDEEIDAAFLKQQIPNLEDIAVFDYEY